MRLRIQIQSITKIMEFSSGANLKKKKSKLKTSNEFKRRFHVNLFQENPCHELEGSRWYRMTQM